jgi:hypothetical protein
MSDALWIAIITGVFGLLGKALDLVLTRSKSGEPPRPKKKSDIMNPTTNGGILNPATIGLLALGVVMGLLVVRVPGLLHPPQATATSTPTVTQPAETQPVQTATVETPPTVTPPVTGLKVGGHAIVHTTAGDKLRIHTQPSFDASVSATLTNGTRVAIIEGPHTVGSDHWWKVETSDGRTGWAVEAVEGIQTLQPSP